MTEVTLNIKSEKNADKDTIKKGWYKAKYHKEDRLIYVSKDWSTDEARIFVFDADSNVIQHYNGLQLDMYTDWIPVNKITIEAE